MAINLMLWECVRFNAWQTIDGDGFVTVWMTALVRCDSMRCDALRHLPCGCELIQCDEMRFNGNAMRCDAMCVWRQCVAMRFNADGDAMRCDASLIRM